METTLLRRAALPALALMLAAAPAAAAPARTPQPTLAPVLREVTPAVVNIAVLTRSPLESNPLYQDPFFRRFFNLPDKPKPQVSAGSGVIVDAAKGYVLTNHHVVKEATQVIVTLKDRRQFEAKLVGSDPGTDIAVLQIEAPNLSSLRFGNSDDLEVGDFVVAIGNPFGLGQTVTSGIVSALGRSGLDIEGYEDFIQTDASINPGNSGGALVNLSGDLVGINTAIIGPAGGNVGIGFAVPVNMARAVMDQILRFGEVRRGRLGVGTQDLTPDLADSLAVGRSEGAVIISVEPGSAADKAGIRTRDVVLAVNGKTVRNSADVRNKVGLVPVGEKLELSLLRNGKPVTARLTVESTEEVSGGRGQQLRELPGALFGNMERGMPGYGKLEGVVVLAVQREGKAATWGLRPGDVIYAVNRKKVRSVSELAQAAKAAGGRMSVSLLRGDYRLTLIMG
ncbi:MAG TPA: DegQ family serine endoprotease [Burkholderiales bacterium]|nr:DegQ family serine endoprotease [Burkholderiales bacterium]